ncbi:hypothetical protein [Nannocystis sp.]|uniref:hypothetical protein n=1 Tax=Nannocystis sp. TaxID=1962667 RepID=UPI0025E3775F|nr:hypothetical protein [Nannocystis sp.]MBK7827715.1 hypothetical protein [Nannocystis sp.]
MQRSLVLAAPALALAGVALMSTPAQAGKGIVLITSGDSVAHYADLTGEMKKMADEATGHDVQLGYKYSQFGLFWLELWTWDGEYVLFHDDTVWELTPDQAAEMLAVKVEDLGTPWRFKLPFGLMILIGLGAAALVWSRMKGKDEGPAAPTAG